MRCDEDTTVGIFYFESRDTKGIKTLMETCQSKKYGDSNRQLHFVMLMVIPSLCFSTEIKPHQNTKCVICQSQKKKKTQFN